MFAYNKNCPCIGFPCLKYYYCLVLSGTVRGVDCAPESIIVLVFSLRVPGFELLQANILAIVKAITNVAIIFFMVVVSWHKFNYLPLYSSKNASTKNSRG